MMLLTKENRKALPALYATEEVPLDETVAHVKFFGGGRWTWYACEFDGEDTFFGYVLSGLGEDCDEWCYFSLSELAAMRFQPFQLPIERDRHFHPAAFGINCFGDR